jgi:nitronate monooxygenase
MSVAGTFASRLRLPVIGSPMFIVSGPKLVIAQCTSGIAGTFPAAGARTLAQLDEWLCEIEEALAAWNRDHPDRQAAPYGVNQIVYHTNDRLEEDLDLCVRHKTPLIISSLGAREDLNRAVQSYGGITLHDVINDRFAHKAIEKGANGLVAVATGAGGHAGRQSPFALVREIREWFDGPVALSGAIATGEGILAAQAMGADFAYMGSAFIATREAAATDAYKQGIVKGRADDIVYTDLFTALHGNYLRESIINAGLDPDNLPPEPQEMDFRSGGKAKTKVWRDIWASGQGIGTIHEVVACATYVERLEREYLAALARLNRIAWRAPASLAPAS